MIRIYVRIENARSIDCRDGLRQSLDCFSLATFAEVWYTLNEIADC